jgi:hypothetical protein
MFYFDVCPGLPPPEAHHFLTKTLFWRGLGRNHRNELNTSGFCKCFQVVFLNVCIGWPPARCHLFSTKTLLWDRLGRNRKNEFKTHVFTIVIKSKVYV